MTRAMAQDEKPLRVAELISSLSLALDIGLGLPVETLLRGALVSSRLAQAAGFSAEDCRAAYYLPLVSMVGCTTTSTSDGEMLGDELGASELMWADKDDMQAMMQALQRSIGRDRTDAERAAMIDKMFAFGAGGGWAAQHAMHCEAARILSERLGLDGETSKGVMHNNERWDGRGTPNGIAGEAITRPARAMHIGKLAAHCYVEGGIDHALSVIGKRAGKEFDPVLVKVIRSEAQSIFANLSSGSIRDMVLAEEPISPLTIGEASIDRAFAAIADFADFKTPHMLGHSRRVANVAELAGKACGLPAADVALLRHAGHVHDLGRVGVQAAIWTKRGALSEGDRERVRLHTYLTERVFADSPLLKQVGALGALHHERLDGSGYHRGLAGAALSAPARILAVANAWCALTEARPHRPTYTEAEAAKILHGEAKAGKLDGRAVDAVLSGQGQKPHGRRTAAISLSDREMEVLRLVARQQSNKDIARVLGISPKTVERHITHVYDKLGVVSRAGATLHAAENGWL
jgi:HD-GYP domain-containing protein (c-di-GMP phosphodiesterase class II)